MVVNLYICMRIFLFPDITIVLDDFAEPPEAARPTTVRFLYEWEQGSAKLPETDVWIFKNRRLNMFDHTFQTQSRRLNGYNSDVCFLVNSLE